LQSCDGGKGSEEDVRLSALLRDTAAVQLLRQTNSCSS